MMTECRRCDEFIYEVDKKTVGDWHFCTNCWENFSGNDRWLVLEIQEARRMAMSRPGFLEQGEEKQS